MLRILRREVTLVVLCKQSAKARHYIRGQRPSESKAASSCRTPKRPLGDVLADDGGQALLGGLGHKLGIGDQRMSQCRTAFALVFRGHGLDGLAQNALSVFGVLA